MEGFLTGTADPLPGGFDAEAVELRRAEKRRRKEDRALRREKKRLKRLPKARIDDEDEEQADVHPESGPRIGAGVTTMTPESMIDPVLVPVSPLVQQEASPSSSPLPSERVANNSSTIPGPSKLRKALRQPKPISSSSTFRRPRRKDSQPTDDEFRSRFSVPGAMEAYLASKWLNLQELKRLADAGGSLLAKSTESPRLMGSRAVISYKKGKFSEGETAAIRRHLGLFSLINRVNEDELVRIIMAKGRSSERKDFVNFWLEVAVVVPGRPVKYVKDHVKRLYDPRGKKGPWSAEEDATLLRAYEVHPNEWTRIGDIVDRTEVDVRDRYKNELQHRSTRRSGHWTKDEETLLIQCVKEANEAIGRDATDVETPWDIISAKMGHTRTRTQVRKKWQVELRLTVLSSGSTEKFNTSERPLLVQRVKALHAEKENEISWDELAVGEWQNYSGRTLRQVWWRMKRGLPHDSLSFPELVSTLEKLYPVDAEVRTRKRKRTEEQLRIVSSAEVDSEDEEIEAEETVESGDEVEREEGG